MLMSSDVPRKQPSRSSHVEITPGERRARRIAAQQFFLTSPIADWLAKHRPATRRHSSGVHNGRRGGRSSLS